MAIIIDLTPKRLLLISITEIGAGEPNVWDDTVTWQDEEVWNDTSD